MQWEQQFFSFDMLVVGMCIVSEMLMLFWWHSWSRKTSSSWHIFEGGKLQLGNLILCTLIGMVSLTLLLLLKAIFNFSNEIGYLFFLIFGFLICGLGISCTFRVILKLEWDKPWVDTCKLVSGIGLLWLFAWGIRCLVLGLIFLTILWINGPWIKLAK